MTVPERPLPSVKQRQTLGRADRQRPGVVVTLRTLHERRSVRAALRRAIPDARVRGSGFTGVLCVDVAGDPLAAAEQVVASCGSMVGRVTPVLTGLPSDRDALVRSAVTVAVDHVGPGQSFAFRIHKRGEHGYLQPTPSLEADVGAAIWQALAERDGTAPRVDLTTPDVLISAEVFGPTTLVGLVRPEPTGQTSCRYVVHVDLDQFIVAVELLRHPELRGLPVVVGDEGDLTRRGVVAGASYEARRWGIHSAMPLRRAASRCPDLVCLPLDLNRYREASAVEMATIRSLGADAVEIAGWDEAFIEVDTADPWDFARRAQTAVLAGSGLVCSVGIGDNKLQAKTATGLAKPGGVAQLTSGTWLDVVGGHPAHDLPGVGPRTARRLAGLGIRTVAQLAEADVSLLAQSFGPVAGPRLADLARGHDGGPVTAQTRSAHSRGHEVTFQDDINAPDLERGEIRSLAARVAAETDSESRPVARVVVKVRFAPFDTHTHGVTLDDERHPSLEEAAVSALGRFVLDRPVRMVGVRAEFERRAARVPC